MAIEGVRRADLRKALLHVDLEAFGECRRQAHTEKHARQHGLLDDQCPSRGGDKADRQREHDRVGHLRDES